jgi:hypothetical protein
MPGNKNFATFAFTIPRNVKQVSRDLRLLACLHTFGAGTNYRLLLRMCVCRPLSSKTRENCQESDYILDVMAGHRG